MEMEAREAMAVTPVKSTNWKLPVLVGGLALLVGLGTWGWRHVAGGAPEDLSGVWRSQATGEVYVFDKEGEDYRLTLAGHRLPVTEVATAGRQLLLTVRTDSGLKAVWSLQESAAENGGRLLRLDKDGFAFEDLSFQRALTSADRTRIDRLRAAKKPLWSPSFDCAKAASDPERLICSDRGLAALDVSLAQNYKALSNQPEQREAQATWLRDVRDGCGDLACMRAAYETRLAALDEAVLDAEGDGGYEAADDEPAAAPAAQADWAEAAPPAAPVAE